ncbi:MAG: hypothetical protein QM708_01090 [Propioniciclava sp.]|uniref:hypothetical protein n=1 Tax=Propioniciclava sp. TaxID=2038686 RepID=UPI0039E5D81A
MTRSSGHPARTDATRLVPPDTPPRPLGTKRTAILAALLLLAGLMAGCTPTTPTPSPTFVTYTCTPEAGGDPYPCTAKEHEEMLAIDALYTEAEAVYRRHMAEVFRIGAHWELSEVTPEIEATAGGPYLERMRDIFATDREERVKQTSGEPIVEWVKRFPGRSMSGSVVALWTCVNGTPRVTSTTKEPGGTPGIITENRLYLSRIDGVLKIWDSEAKVVETC